MTDDVWYPDEGMTLGSWIRGYGPAGTPGRYSHYLVVCNLEPALDKLADKLDERYERAGNRWL